MVLQISKYQNIHYITPRVKDRDFNEATLHFGANDLLQHRNIS